MPPTMPSMPSSHCASSSSAIRTTRFLPTSRRYCASDCAMTQYTLAAPARFVLEVKKSRFLAQATAVETPTQALAWLAQISDPDATHNCWAYRVGSAYRFSDDGEPGGTAGRPILSAIEGQGIDRVIVVVTRWYGGINLGAGGLVRAYGGAAAECLRTAARREVIDT